MVAVLGDRFCPDGKRKEEHTNEPTKGSEVQRDPWPLGDLPLRSQRPSQIPCNPVRSLQTIYNALQQETLCALSPATIYKGLAGCGSVLDKLPSGQQHESAEGVLVQER